MAELRDRFTRIESFGRRCVQQRGKRKQSGQDREARPRDLDLHESA
jgi:hypothetical protein